MGCFGSKYPRVVEALGQHQKLLGGLIRIARTNGAERFREVEERKPFCFSEELAQCLMGGQASERSSKDEALLVEKASLRVNEGRDGRFEITHEEVGREVLM